MNDIYEGMCAVCAVLAEAERTPRAPALGLARRHLHLLARLLAARLPEAPGTGGDAAPEGRGGTAATALWAPAPQGVCHVRQ